MKTKRLYSQIVQNEIRRKYPNADSLVREQEIWLRMDQLVNRLAKQSYFDNWAFTGGHADEQYITTWADENAIQVVDQPHGKPSYLILPSNYADIPRNGGIEEIWPMTYSGGSNSVVVMSHRDYRRYQTNKAGNMQGRLYGYPEGRKFIFGKANVATDYSEKFGVRLMIRDSSMIDLDAPYPLPSSAEQAIIDQLIAYFSAKLLQPMDAVRDGNEQPIEP